MPVNAPPTVSSHCLRLRLRLAATELRSQEAWAALRRDRVELVVAAALPVALDAALVGRATTDDSEVGLACSGG